MIKRFFIFLFWVPLLSSAQIRVDAEGAKLNGNVKKMVEYQYSFWGKKNRNETLGQTVIYKYDEKTDQETVYSYHGTDSTRYFFKDVFWYAGSKVVVHQHVQKVNGHGDYMKDDSTCWLVTYQYGDNGSLIEEVSTLGDKDPAQHYDKACYLYDKRGNVIEKDTYHHASSLDDTIKNIFRYDSGGHVLQKDYYSGHVAVQTICKYSRHYHYSEELTIDTVPGRERKTIRRYDNRMNLIEERSYCRCDGTRTKNKYKYDDKGNWVERTNYMHRKKHSYVKRVITY